MCRGSQRGDTRFWPGQRVIGMPPLSLNNRFAVLPVEEIHEFNSDSATDYETKAIPCPPPQPHLSRCLKWEKRLPKCYIMAANPGSNSFELEVSIQTTDTGEMHATTALLDLGATGLFVNILRYCDHSE